MVIIISVFNSRPPEVEEANTPSLAFLLGLVLSEGTFLGTLSARKDGRHTFCADVCVFQWLFSMRQGPRSATSHLFLSRSLPMRRKSLIHRVASLLSASATSPTSCILSNTLARGREDAELSSNRSRVPELNS